MASTIIQPTIPNVQRIMDPVYLMAANNEFYKALFAATIGTAAPVRFQANGYNFDWAPDNIQYIDDAGNMDVVYGVNANASAQAWKNHVNYVGTTQLTSDEFSTEGNQLKHYTRLVAPPRLPAGYMGTPVQVAIGGTIGYDPTLQICTTDGPQTKDFTVTGDIAFRDSDGAEVYRLPMIFAQDANGQTVNGEYKVTFNADGTISFYMCIGWDYLQIATYPVVIDPTVVVAGAYDISASGGRKIVKLDNGWIIIAAYNPSTADTNVYIYVSKDNGQTWAQLCYCGALGSSSQGTYALVSHGNIVYMPFASGYVYCVAFDATTVTNTNLMSTKTTADSATTGFNTGGCLSAAIDGTGALHVHYTCHTSQFSNSYNVRYCKGTTSGTTVTWGTPYQVTSLNSAGAWYQYPCTFVNSTNTPFVAYEYYNGNSSYELLVYKLSGGSWVSAGASPNGGLLSYAQGNMSVAVDGNDNFHMTWHGKDANMTGYFNIFYSKSTDSGSTWSAYTRLTTNGQQQNPSITADSSNNLYVYWEGVIGAISTSYFQICTMKYAAAAGTWGASSTLTNNTTNSASHAQTLWSKFNMNSNDAVRYAWQDAQASQLLYDSIHLNSPPNAPTLTAHGNFDATIAQNLAWAFSDPDAGDSQSAYQLQIQDVSTGTNVVDTGKVASTAQTYALAANTVTNGKQYQWRVTTWDQSGAQGPWSQYSAFTTAAAPTVNITDPANGSTDITSSVTVNWSYADAGNNSQQSYRVQLLQADDTTNVEDTGTVADNAGNTRSRTMQTVLTNNTTYHIKVWATNSKGVTSVASDISFTASFTPPATATITVTGDAANARIGIAIANPAPSGTQPAVSGNDVYRVEHGTTDTPIRIAANVANNGTFYDYTARSGVSYDYYVITNGNNNTTAQSATVTGNVTFTGVWLHDTSDPAGTVHHFKYDGQGRKSDWKVTGAALQFDGRKRPVAEFAEFGTGEMDLNLQMLTGDNDYTALQALIQGTGTLCYRDDRGRKVFGVVFELPLQDQFWGYTSSFKMQEVDYTEAV